MKEEKKNWEGRSTAKQKGYPQNNCSKKMLYNFKLCVFSIVQLKRAITSLSGSVNSVSLLREKNRALSKKESLTLFLKMFKPEVTVVRP